MGVKQLHFSIALTVLAGVVLLGADDKKTTRPAPPPKKAAVTRAPATGSGPPVRSTGGTSTVQPSGRGVYSPNGTSPSTGGGTGTPASTTKTSPYDRSTGQSSGRRVYNPTIATPPGNGGTGSSTGRMPPAGRPNAGTGMPQIYHAPVGVTRGPQGKIATYRAANGNEAHFAPNGSVRSVSTRGMTIVHAPGAGRTVVMDRPDHTRIYTDAAGHGYVQRPFNYHGHEYAQRTYYVNNTRYVTYYRSYTYNNVYLVGYAPAHYYSPMFYGWAYHPWARPVVYVNWGWGGSPWYGYYGWYFTPYRTYPSAAFWLTDFVIAASLQAAYQQQVDAQQAAYQQQGPPPPAYGQGGQVALTPEVKQAIADEVQRQLALENSEGQQVGRNQEPDPASSGLPRMLGDGEAHVFIVANPLDVTDAMGQSCVVTQGDVLQMQTPPPQTAEAGFLNVLASKGGQDCATGDVVTVAFSDLQEMQNQMRAGIDGGLQQMQAQAGQNGLPPTPPGAGAPPVQSAFAPIAPPPDPNVANELNQQALAANQAENQVLSEAGNGSGGGQ